MKGNLAIGIDLGGTNVKGVLIREDGELLQSLQMPMQDRLVGGKEPADHWKQVVRQMLADLEGGRRVEVVGLSAPGLPDKNNEKIVTMPGRLLGLEGLHWGDYLNKQRVTVLNDALSALMAECSFGVGKGMQNVIMLTLGTGVGGGIMIGGEVYQGHGQRAGHLGHMVIDSTEQPGITRTPGSLEDAIGNATLEVRSQGKFKSTENLVKAYESGDQEAARVWLESVRKLAVGICSLCNVISPHLVILGGGIALAGEALFKPLAEFMELYEWRPQGLETVIKKAELNEFAGAIGAAAFAFKDSGDRS
ncbi:MAG: ROK family protein [Verrucomicrobiota bacterium]